MLKRLEGREKEAALAYVYGFCCHFALDVSCHRYIDKKIEADGVSHTEIEVEFDRSLMGKDGYNPVTHILTDHIKPSSKMQILYADFMTTFHLNRSEKRWRA